jgi:DNA-binding SARP family transcriptional activator
MVGAMITVRALGPLHVEVDGQRAELGGRKAGSLLARLLVAGGAVVPADRLVEALWPNGGPASARNSLQVYVARLRRVLEPQRQAGERARTIRTAPDGYALDPAAPGLTVDALLFEARVAQARHARDAMPADAGLLREALDLWRGPAYAEFTDHVWAADESARLEELRYEARELSALSLLRGGAAAAAAVEAEKLTRERPFREEGWRLLVLALWAVDRQADALAALRRVRALLREELGIDPGPRLVELESAVPAQRRAVLEAATVHTGSGTVALASAAANGPDHRPAPVPVSPPFVVPAAALTSGRLVGRSAELAALGTAAEQARWGSARTVLLSGEAGIGKSALLARTERHLTEAGWTVVVARCPEGGAPAAAGAWLEGLADLGAAHPPRADLAATLRPLTAAGAWADDRLGAHRVHRAFVSWLRDLAAVRPLALLLDDLHRGDVERLELFLSAAEGLVDLPVLLVGAYRPGEGDLTEALDRLARHSPVRLRLSGLSAGEAIGLLRSACPVPMSTQTATAVAARTGGNPFYVLETARLVADEGEQQALSLIPEGVLEVLRRRLARLDPAVLPVLQLAAVAGREIPAAVLMRAADHDEVLDALDAGLSAGLLENGRPGQVRFSHALVRDALTADLSSPRLARLHSRIGNALLAHPEPPAQAVAHHLLAASALLPADAPPAVAWTLRTCEEALHRYTPLDAEALVTAALQRLDEHPDAFAAADPPALRGALLCRLVHCRIRTGAVRGAREAQQEAIQDAARQGRDDLLTAAYCAWSEPTPWRTRPYAAADPLAVRHLTRLLDSGAVDAPRRGPLLVQLADAMDNTDPAARRTAHHALDAAEHADDPVAACQALALLLRLVDFDHEPEAYRDLQGRLTTSAERTQRPEHVWFSAYTAARMAAASNDPRAMELHLTRADELAATHHLHGARAVTALRHVMTATAHGEFGRAEETLAAAVDALKAADAMQPTGVSLLALACIREPQQRMDSMLPLALRAWERTRPRLESIPVLALLAAGREREARAIHAQRVPLRPDFAFGVLAGLRARAALALDDRAEAATLYQALQPFRDRVAGASSLSMLHRPVAQTLGELALRLGHEEAAAEHFHRAEAVARLWRSPHWVAAARRRPTR